MGSLVYLANFVFHFQWTNLSQRTWMTQLAACYFMARLLYLYSLQQSSITKHTLHQTAALLVYVLPNFCNHQIVISITVCSPERSHIEYTRMPSPIYQYMIDLIMSLLIRRGPGVFMNVSVQEHRALNNQILWCGKPPLSNTIIITILM
jgi:hypothetical protein